MAEQDRSMERALRIELDRFVDDQVSPGKWERITAGGLPGVRWWAYVTDEYSWDLRLYPLGTWNGPSSRWEVVWFNGRGDRSVRKGTLAECRQYVHDLEELFTRYRRVAQDLEEFGEARPSWQFSDHPDGRYYVSRKFAYGDGTELWLSIHPEAPSSHRDRFRGQVNGKFSEGADYPKLFDTIGEAGEWADEWGKLLEVPYKIGGCDTAGEAREVADRVRGRDLVNLCYLLDIDQAGYERMRRALVERFGPKVGAR